MSPSVGLEKPDQLTDGVMALGSSLTLSRSVAFLFCPAMTIGGWNADDSSWGVRVGGVDAVCIIGDAAMPPAMPPHVLATPAPPPPAAAAVPAVPGLLQLEGYPPPTGSARC